MENEFPERGAEQDDGLSEDQQQQQQEYNTNDPAVLHHLEEAEKIEAQLAEIEMQQKEAARQARYMKASASERKRRKNQRVSGALRLHIPSSIFPYVH